MGGLARVKLAILFLCLLNVGRLRLKCAPIVARIYSTTVTTAITGSPITLDRTSKLPLKQGLFLRGRLQSGEPGSTLGPIGNLINPLLGKASSHLHERNLKAERPEANGESRGLSKARARANRLNPLRRWKLKRNHPSHPRKTKDPRSPSRRLGRLRGGRDLGECTRLTEVD